MKLFAFILFGLCLRAAELPPNPPGFNLQAIFQTNDAPVRRWNGAMVAPQPQTVTLTGGSVTFVTPRLISVSGVVDIEELFRAVVFRQSTKSALTPEEEKRFMTPIWDTNGNPINIIPPMPPSTNTNESATMRAMNTLYRETPAQRAQRLWFEHGGQKGRPTPNSMSPTPKIERRQ